MSVKPGSRRKIALAFFAVAITALANALGCATPCDDIDGDGYGPGCSLGSDCDERNATRNVDCIAVPAPDCGATPVQPGCACFSGSISTCYDGPPDTRDVGLCKSGRAFCTDGFFGLCQNSVVPDVELCNELDDDCDGIVDEFVRSPCGGCNAACQGETWGPYGTRFVDGGGLVATTAGGVELARSPPLFDGVWFPNSGEDTVSHLSAASASEVGRHASGGDDPSRVAVDYAGDVFVTNRAFGGQGTLTKFAGDQTRCVDADGSNTIQTSTGPGDVPALAQDECVLFSVPVGTLGDVPRALVIDGSVEPGGGGGGDPWVGLHDGEAVVHVDGVTGTVLERVELPGLRPYAAAADDRGALYFASQQGEIATIDRSTSPPTVTRRFVNLSCYSTYGIVAVDDGVLLGTGQSCDQLYRMDVTTGTTRRVATQPNPRSIAQLGSLAFVPHTDGRLSIVDVDTLAVAHVVDLWAMGESPLESIGVSVDSLGMVWVASGQAADGSHGLATRVDPATRAVLAQVPLGLAPHLQGDATGRALRGVFGPSGSATAVFRGCTGVVPTDWKALYLDAAVGVGGTVRIELRYAVDEASLANEAFVPIIDLPASPAAFWSLDTVPEDAVVELRLTLTSTTRDASPVVREIGLQADCTGQVE